MTGTEITKFSIRKNDTVQVMAGREKGKIGKVLSVDSKKGRILIEKTNMLKKHMRPTQQNPQGGVVEKEAALHYSNVLLMCPKCNRGVRHGRKKAEVKAKKSPKKGTAEGAATKTVRFCKRCEEVLGE